LIFRIKRFPLTQKDYHHSSKLSDEFHTYGLYWSKEKLYTYLDDPDNVVLEVDLENTNFWELGNFASSYNKYEYCRFNHFTF
jgi:hypothetical protein